MKRRVITSRIAPTSLLPSTVLMMNRRYSLLRGRPSSNTTIEATTSVPMRVGDVVALDPQRHLGQVERLLELLEGEVAGGQVAGSTHLVQGEGVGGVAGGGLQQRCLVAALRHPQLHPRTALLA